MTLPFLLVLVLRGRDLLPSPGRPIGDLDEMTESNSSCTRARVALIALWWAASSRHQGASPAVPCPTRRLARPGEGRRAPSSTRPPARPRSCRHARPGDLRYRRPSPRVARSRTYRPRGHVRSEDRLDYAPRAAEHLRRGWHGHNSALQGDAEREATQPRDGRTRTQLDSVADQLVRIPLELRERSRDEGAHPTSLTCGCASARRRARHSVCARDVGTAEPIGSSGARSISATVGVDRRTSDAGRASACSAPSWCGGAVAIATTPTNRR